MKKIINLFSTLLYLIPTATLATIPPPDDPGGVPTNLSAGITKISNTILLIIATISVLMLIIGGFQYITAAGNPDSIGKAKSTILYAILGIIFAILAFAIVSFITTSLVP